MLELPPELIEEIVEYLDYPDVVRFYQVNIYIFDILDQYVLYQADALVLGVITDPNINYDKYIRWIMKTEKYYHPSILNGASIKLLREIDSCGYWYGTINITPQLSIEKYDALARIYKQKVKITYLVQAYLINPALLRYLETLPCNTAYFYSDIAKILRDLNHIDAINYIINMPNINISKLFEICLSYLEISRHIAELVIRKNKLTKEKIFRIINSLPDYNLRERVLSIQYLIDNNYIESITRPSVVDALMRHDVDYTLNLCRTGIISTRTLVLSCSRKYVVNLVDMYPLPNNDIQYIMFNCGRKVICDYGMALFQDRPELRDTFCADVELFATKKVCRSVLYQLGYNTH